MSESETVAKNRIEFQWGSKLQGTSSEALLKDVRVFGGADAGSDHNLDISTVRQALFTWWSNQMDYQKNVLDSKSLSNIC